MSSTTKLLYVCPACHANVKGRPLDSGEQVQCPGCGKSVHLALALEGEDGENEIVARVVRVLRPGVGRKPPEQILLASPMQIVCGLLVLFGIVAFALNGGIGEQKYTMEKYDQIQTNMHHDRVVKILRSSGTELSRVELGGYLTIMVEWQNRDGSNMNVMFQNGYVISKAQSGLR